MIKESKDAQKAKKDAEVPDFQKGIGGFGNVCQPELYNKLIDWLVKLNSVANQGLEISSV